jgi:hypothetical protein
MGKHLLLLHKWLLLLLNKWLLWLNKWLLLLLGIWVVLLARVKPGGGHGRRHGKEGNGQEGLHGGFAAGLLGFDVYVLGV